MESKVINTWLLGRRHSCRRLFLSAIHLSTYFLSAGTRSRTDSIKARFDDYSRVAHSVFTVVRLADGATLDRACKLAGIAPASVTLTQKVGEKPPDDLPHDFRIISFDGLQITISERIDGERRVRGFAA